MKKILTYSLLFLIIGMQSACSDFLRQTSQDLVAPKTPTDLDELMVGGVDGYLPSYELSACNARTEGAWFNVMDDDLNTVIYNNSSTASWKGVVADMFFGYSTWQLDVGRNLANNNSDSDEYLWASLYRRINAANMILFELDKMPINTAADQAIATRLRGECLFLRGQFFFILANLYGKAYEPATAAQTLSVPLKLTPFVEHDKNKEVQFERAPVAQVYEQIEKDLLQAVALLTESPQLRPQYRASKEAALLLLSRLYLYSQQWQKSVNAVNRLFETKKELYDYRAILTSGVAVSEESPELIFSQGSLCLQNTMTGEGGGICATRELYELYADGEDLRKEIYFKTYRLTDSIALNRKYKMGVYRSRVSDAFTLRTAEAYLNAAEALAMLHKTDSACLMLNRLRHNRYQEFVMDVAMQGEELVNEIRNERRRELCFEGHRWFDLRRYAVNAEYPYKRTITRVFAVYDNENRLNYINSRVYRLLPDDPAYVLQIPRALLVSEPKQIPNERVKRDFEILNENTEDDEEGGD